MRHVLLMVCVVAIAAGSVFAVDLNPPPWDPRLPNQTSQAWEFGHGWPGPEPTSVDNPYGQPWVQFSQATYWAGGEPTTPLIPGHDGQPIPTWHIDQTGGGVMIYIPNNPEPNKEKLIFWQITSDKAPDPSGPGSNPPGASGPDPYGPAGWTVDNWYTYNGLYRIPQNPPEEWLWFTFPESTNIEEIVIDTVCVPEPATLALVAFGGLLALRRKGQGKRGRA